MADFRKRRDELRRENSALASENSTEPLSRLAPSHDSHGYNKLAVLAAIAVLAAAPAVGWLAFEQQSVTAGRHGDSLNAGFNLSRLPDTARQELREPRPARPGVPEAVIAEMQARLVALEENIARLSSAIDALSAVPESAPVSEPVKVSAPVAVSVPAPETVPVPEAETLTDAAAELTEINLDLPPLLTSRPQVPSPPTAPPPPPREVAAVPASPAPPAPWKINLISTPSREEATRFAGRAQARGVEAQLMSVSVRGSTYWRVHVAGFATHAEARAYSDRIQGQLGLKETWIHK